ncbi:hypothetical protein PAAG_11756 [Paracoccidioides lutzii Pb01]|uniref:Uncharacterized protein n=1 Tax=Paracoccidioides lutzii (strain ATCC MYA-826 / Pb01) TaxID=502779 RepID=A0A0A2VKV7_PARBA|nr:hypothetical protein PAAG_11756 [Paracoccidioides lutzii Pb01]KGQ01519.1 hypothetical protein PAAG_11756 [Paracoccidioides lutzii Pb01]
MGVFLSDWQLRSCRIRVGYVPSDTQNSLSSGAYGIEELLKHVKRTMKGNTTLNSTFDNSWKSRALLACFSHPWMLPSTEVMSCVVEQRRRPKEFDDFDDL